MTLSMRGRAFRASSTHYEKNRSASAATRVVPALLIQAEDQSHEDGIAIFQGHRFVGILTQEDARRVADDIHDLLDTLEQAA